MTLGMDGKVMENISKMTYNVLMGTLNLLTHSLCHP